MLNNSYQNFLALTDTGRQQNKMGAHLAVFPQPIWYVKDTTDTRTQINQIFGGLSNVVKSNVANSGRRMEGLTQNTLGNMVRLSVEWHPGADFVLEMRRI